jgi:O-antigen/teichoic acid export membrane protein
MLACLLAWPVASFYGTPDLVAMLPVSGLAVLIAGFDSITLLTLRRHLAVSKLVAINVVAQLCAVATMLTWAFVHRSVWSLVAGGVASALVKMLLSHLAIGGPSARPGWDREAGRELFHFGKWIFLSTVFAFLVGQADRLIFGKIVSLEVLGVYSIAAMFSLLPVNLVTRIGTSVVFPAFSRHRESGADFAPVFRRTRAPLVVLGGLFVAGAVAAGPPLIRTLYDPRYADAGWMLQVLAIGAWFRVLEVPTGSVLLAFGASRSLAVANAIKLAAVVVLVPLGAWLYGFPGAIAAFVASESVRYAAIALATEQRGVACLRPDLLMTALLAATCALGLGAGSLVRDAGAVEVVCLVAAAGAAALAWLAAAYAVMRRDLGRLALRLRNAQP